MLKIFEIPKYLFYKTSFENHFQKLLSKLFVKIVTKHGLKLLKSSYVVFGIDIYF